MVLPHVCNHGSRKENWGSDIYGKTALKAGISERIQAAEVIHDASHVRQHIDPWTEVLERLRNDVVRRRIVGKIYLQEVPIMFPSKRRMLWRDVDS